jgi:hypothetical protein
MIHESLRELVRLIAAEKNLHVLVARVASDARLLNEARRTYEDRRSHIDPRGQELSDLCRSHRISLESFEHHLTFLARILNLTEHEEDYYQILDLERGASSEEIKSAFRRLSLASHPDTNPGDPLASQRFQGIHHAYEILSNRDLRQQYDQSLSAPRWREDIPEAELRPIVPSWRKWRRILPAGALIGLLLALIFMVDYDSLLIHRYYHAKQVDQSTLAPGVSTNGEARTASAESSDKNTPPVPPIPETDAMSKNALEVMDKSVEAPPSGSHVSDVKHNASQVVLSKSASEVTTSQPQKKANDGIRAANEPPPQLEPRLSSPARSPDEKAKPAPSSPQTAPNSLQQLASKVLADAPRASPPPASFRPHDRSESPAAAGRSLRESAPENRGHEQKSTVGNDLTNHIQHFVNRYAQAFEKKNASAFLSLFEPDAQENGEPLTKFLPVYIKNFDRAQWISYRIQVVKWKALGEGVDVEGKFRLSVRLKDDSKSDSAGNIRLKLIKWADDYRVRRLDYSFTD